eukprot:CAMPEP_0201738662 /NCGR_PEP_ID=MMETSP0593-20130828/45373_1 /ASSEMBLY_ACC=CAM_ASM_000672 /TAXON_ID=267983 /ORGANISM="Skeletonema japonicum, Strain CCMP2506" /LENGTH=651 /DNA_ID=CAMNT_0048232889 /DNA_START=60 /DNA_END=2015 /DNA_ORIENTATION=-
MSAADVAVGMMDGAYFTSRNELLTFFNTLLNVQLTKIEQTASGAIACQLTEYLFPNSIPMTKVNWAAKSSHEYVGNYKLLQKAFTRNKVQRYVDVDKLIRGKYQDNLEFCQWLKAFFDMQNGGNNAREGYDPVAVRAKGKGGKTVPVMTKAKGAANAGSNGRARASVRPSSSSVSSSSGRSAKNGPVVGKARIGSSASSSSSSSAAAPSRSSPRRMTSSSSSTSTTTSTTTTTAASARSSRPVRERPVPTQKENNSATNLPKTSRKPTTTTTTSSSSTPSSISTAQVKKQYQSEINKLQHQNTTLQTQLTDLQLLSTEIELNMTTVESERDFYFEKLRGIEVMLQVYKEKEESGELLSPRGSGGGEMKRVIEKIFKVMYAAAEDNVVVDDEGNIVGDVAMDDSFVQNNNESFGSIRPHAQDELDDDDDDDELLTSGIVDPVEAPLAVEQVNVAQLSDDDDDDDELLTSGIISPVNEVVLASLSDTVENIDVAAQPKLDGDDDDDDDDDELLTSGIISPVNEVVLASSDAVENIVVSTQPELDDDDDDDDELLTSGIISPVNEVILATSDAVENIVVSAQPELDDVDDDDDELLTSGIDSGDDAVPEDDATNRSAENARIISQLVGDNDELNDNGSSDEEELLVDDASQDEY